MKKLRKFFYDNGSFIFSALSIIGVGLTSLASIKASFKAMDKLEDAQNEANRELTTKEKIKIMFPIYIFPVSMAVATIGCILCSSIINEKHELAITNSYIALNETYRMYKQKVKELYGQEAHLNVMQSIAENKKGEALIAESPLSKMLFEDEPNVLFFDEFSGRYFETKPSIVALAEYNLNRSYVYDGFADVNTFYSYLGLPPIPGGQYLTWDIDDEVYWIDFYHSQKEVTDDGLTCVSIAFTFDPVAYDGNSRK